MQQLTEIVTLPLSRTDSVNPANCWGFKDALLVCHSVSLLAVAPNLSKSEANPRKAKCVQSAQFS